RHTRWPRDWSSDVCCSDLIFPCFVFEVDEEGKTVAIPKLLDLKSTVLNDLMVKYENGIEDEDEQGKEIRIHDITIGDFELTRSGDRKSTRLNSSHVAISYA